MGHGTGWFKSPGNKNICSSFSSAYHSLIYKTSIFCTMKTAESVPLMNKITRTKLTSLQAFASTIMGTLTTHSIMQGIGVGESTATPLAAAITWTLKNGTGMIGSIMFAWWNG